MRKNVLRKQITNLSQLAERYKTIKKVLELSTSKLKIRFLNLILRSCFELEMIAKCLASFLKKNFAYCEGIQKFLQSPLLTFWYAFF